MNGPVAVVLKGYPRLSETFIAQEILALERAGMDLEIVSLRRPTDSALHPVHNEISASVRYLPEYLHDDPLRVLRGWLKSRRMPGYKAARRAWLKDLRRDFTRNRIRRWGQALVLAAELPETFTHLYAHFLHTPASVTRYTSLLRDLPWTCSAHAKDIWTSPDWELQDKLASADWTVTCTEFGWRHLRGLAGDEERVHLVYHGLDLQRFEKKPTQRGGGDGSNPDAPVLLLTVGRAVEKKGLDTLLEALSKLPPGLHWRWHHVGGGELTETLKAQATALGLDEQVVWHGGQPQEFVLDLYRRSDLFVLPCRVARDGDRDGLPNVFMEAMSQALPCISTPVSGVPEIIRDEETGLLVEPDDPVALGTAVERLVRDPQLRARLGSSGETRVRSHFDHRAGTVRLLDLFGHEADPGDAKRGAA